MGNVFPFFPFSSLPIFPQILEVCFFGRVIVFCFFFFGMNIGKNMQNKAILRLLKNIWHELLDCLVSIMVRWTFHLYLILLARIGEEKHLRPRFVAKHRSRWLNRPTHGPTDRFIHTIPYLILWNFGLNWLIARFYFVEWSFNRNLQLLQLLWITNILLQTIVYSLLY